jgi:deazaflavin-dependent oxidoreductase (nitroreductase family)
MTSATPERTSAGGMLAPVSPAPFVRTVMRPMTKVLNPLIVRFAGRKHFFMAARIQHVGRRSGKLYVTPATAHVHGDRIVIALTFGNQSDWARNVRAAGGCLVRFNGRSYQGTDPQFLSREEAQPVLKAAFSPLLRAGTRLLGVRQFLVLRAVPT